MSNHKRSVRSLHIVLTNLAHQTLERLRDYDDNADLVPKTALVRALDALTELRDQAEAVVNHLDEVIPDEVPALDVDAGTDLDTRCRLERRIVYHLLKYLKNNCWTVRRVWSDARSEPVSTVKEAMELIFNLDDAVVELEGLTGNRHSILLIPGNDVDIIADHSTFSGDNFGSLMHAFNPEDHV